MKILSKKNVIIVSIATVIAGSIGAGALMTDKQEEPIPISVKTSVGKEIANVEEDKLSISHIEEPVLEEVPEQSNLTPVEVPPTPQKSARDYGLMYLNLSNPELISCFDKIVARYPDRFVGEVTENNVKALGVYGSVCSTGILEADYGRTPIIDQFGANGAFFDSELAKTKH